MLKLIKWLFVLINMLKFVIYFMTATFLYLQLRAQGFPKSAKLIDLAKFIDAKLAISSILIAVLLGVESLLKGVRESNIKHL